MDRIVNQRVFTLAILFCMVLLATGVLGQVMPNDTTATKELQEVKIDGSAKPMEVSKGKLTYNVEKSPAAAGSSALDILRRTPGVNVDQNENIVLKGSTAVNVMIDGKMSYLSSQQLGNLLKGMRADQISKIEVITAPSAQYDASGNSGIINIITRKSNKKGYALDVSSGLTLGRYLLNSQSVTGNVRTQKLNFFGNLGYNYLQSYRKEISTQVSNSVSGERVITDRDGINPNKSNYYSYKAGFDFYLNTRSQLGLAYTGTTDDWSKDANSITYLRNGSGDLQSYLRSDNIAVEPFYNNIYNLNYLFRIDSTGKTLSADADHISYRNNSDGFLSSNSFTALGMPTEPHQQLNFHQPSYIDIYAFKTDLVHPTKTVGIKAGLKYSSVVIDNNFRYDSLKNNVFVYAPSLSDHFVYKEKIAAGYISATKNWKTLDAEIGLRVEHTSINGNSVDKGVSNIRDYLDFFPTFSISKKLSTTHKFDLSVSRRINRPNYAKLNPVRYFTDKYAYFQGNPNLLPEKAWIASLSYTFLDKYITSLSYNHSNNFITRSVRVDPETGVLINSNDNYKDINRVDVQLIVPFILTDFWEVTTHGTLSYTTYPIAQLSGYKQVSQTTVDLFAGQNLKLPGETLVEITARYTSPELMGLYLTRYYFSLNGGIKKSILAKRLDLRFAFADLFQTGRFWGYSITDNVNYTYKNTPDSRRFSLTLVYHMGGKLTTDKPHRTDEQNRL